MKERREYVICKADLLPYKGVEIQIEKNELQKYKIGDAIICNHMWGYLTEITDKIIERFVTIK